MAKFIPKKFEKEVISMRISVDTLREIDRKASEYGISRNKLINQMIEYALDNMEGEEDGERMCPSEFRD